jgi:hypothetical protein
MLPSGTFRPDATRKTPVLIRLFISLVLVAPCVSNASARAAPAPPSATVYALRTQAFSVCCNVLVYYNPQQDAGDPEHLQQYQQGVAHLQQLAANAGDQQLIGAAAEVRGNVLLALHRQSIDVEALLLYQTRVHGSLGVHLDSVNDDTVAQLDKTTEQRFDEIAQQWPQQADELARV